MALLGQGAIAMWWDIATEHRSEFEDWHTHEHFPERMGIPGFLRGSRWSELDGEGFFVMYELEAYETLASDAYLARLNQPTPWSKTMMPRHRNMVRSQCRVVASVGGALSRYALTVRLSPAAGQENELLAHLSETSRDLRARPGTAAAHLLQHQTPRIHVTEEQRIRGGPDPAADWIFIACGYDRAAVAQVADHKLSDDVLLRSGAAVDIRRGMYELCHSNTARDLH